MKAPWLSAIGPSSVADLLRRVDYWLFTVRRCAWCGQRIGGNPLAKTTSHGICPSCLAKQSADMILRNNFKQVHEVRPKTTLK